MYTTNYNNNDSNNRPHRGECLPGPPWDPANCLVFGAGGDGQMGLHMIIFTQWTSSTNKTYIYIYIYICLHTYICVYI